MADDNNRIITTSDGRRWVSDGGKRDNWETFEDCHTCIDNDNGWWGLVEGIIVIAGIVALILCAIFKW